MFHGDSTTEPDDLTEWLYHPLPWQQASRENNSVAPRAKERRQEFERITQNHSVHIAVVFDRVLTSGGSSCVVDIPFHLIADFTFQFKLTSSSMHRRR